MADSIFGSLGAARLHIDRLQLVPDALDCSDRHRLLTVWLSPFLDVRLLRVSLEIGCGHEHIN
jgi:hypothetical protein